MLWPQPGYDTRSKKYTFKGPKQRGAQNIKDAKDKLTDKLPSNLGGKLSEKMSSRLSSRRYKPKPRYRPAPKPSEQIYMKPAHDLRLPRGVEPTDEIAKKPGKPVEKYEKPSKVTDSLSSMLDRIGKKKPKEIEKKSDKK